MTASTYVRALDKLQKFVLNNNSKTRQDKVAQSRTCNTQKCIACTTGKKHRKVQLKDTLKQGWPLTTRPTPIWATNSPCSTPGAYRIAPASEKSRECSSGPYYTNKKAPCLRIPPLGNGCLAQVPPAALLLFLVHNDCPPPGTISGSFFLADERRVSDRPGVRPDLGQATQRGSSDDGKVPTRLRHALQPHAEAHGGLGGSGIYRLSREVF